jgi:zinc protease
LSFALALLSFVDAAGLALLETGGVGAAESPAYVVAVSARTRADAAWQPVVEALREKHAARVVEFHASPDEILPELRRQPPRYVGFVARPEEASREFVRLVHHLTRRVDGDPYPDVFWGIVTGYDAGAALRMARHREPLTVRKVASGTEVALEMCEEGVWFCELNKGKTVRKEKGGPAVESKGPDDSTEALVKAINEYQPDLFVTSGHATEHDWMIGFRYRNGFFKHADGRLFGEDTQGRKWPIASTHAKVYLPIGNCLMGHIDRPDCMALSWMNSGGVMQMPGYTLPTWYGYAGWGLLDYFVEQPGRYTLTEAFFANQLALIHRLTTYFPELKDADADASGRSSVPPVLSARARADGLSLNDARGLLFDRDVLAFYGDPAWAGRMADQPRAFEQKLSREGDRFVFEIKPNRGERSFGAINRNGSQRGGRPFVAFLPERIRDAQVLEGAELNPVILDDFILVPNPGTCDPAKSYRVVFRASGI